MKNFIYIIIGVVICYLGYQHFIVNKVEPLYDESYVLLYGKTTCGWCQKMEKDLNARDIPYTFQDLKIKAVNDELHPRMKKAGIDISRYNIPVIDVNGEFFIRPDIATVVEAYNMASRGNDR